jgi:predicted nuclease of predicted toxin-antitoxin system
MGRKLADALNASGVHAIHHDDVFPEATPDEEWLARAGAENWVVITKDKLIRKRPIERMALKRAKARAFVFTGGNLSGVETTEIILGALPRMQRMLAARSASFIARINGAGVVVLIEER